MLFSPTTENSHQAATRLKTLLCYGNKLKIGNMMHSNAVYISLKATGRKVHPT